MLRPLLVAAIVATQSSPAPPPAAAPTPLPSPVRLLGLIRAKFHSHRPPPPYEVYVIQRKENTEEGFPDYENSYTEHVWVRNADRAALARRIYRGINRGQPMFERPAFNEDRDPGPPTADLFEPAPLHPHPVSQAYTPEPSATDLRQIGEVRVYGEFDYRVVSIDPVGDQLHVTIAPKSDPDRNRLRELWVDRATLELRKVVATDKLFVGADVYSVLFTITLDMQDGIPVVTDIHGVVGDGYTGDGTIVDYTFRDISFPTTLPDWYFDPRQYAQHMNDLPS